MPVEVREVREVSNASIVAIATADYLLRLLCTKAVASGTKVANTPLFCFVIVVCKSTLCLL